MTLKPTKISGYFKRGSSWEISLTRLNPDQTPVNLTGLVTRAMFRTGGVNGPVVVTLTEGAGIEIANPATGTLTLKISRTQSELFTAGDTVFFDIEQTLPATPTYACQSMTYYFVVIEQVTRDDS